MNEEETYKVTVYLINGKKLKVYGGQYVSSIENLYKTLGAVGGRIKFPTDHKTFQYLPASSVLRVEVNGFFD